MGGELHSTSIGAFSPKIKDTDRLENCLAVFTIIIFRDDSTKLLFFQLFIDHLSVRRQGVPRPHRVASNWGCSYKAEAWGGGGLRSRWTPAPSLAPQAMPLPGPAGRAYPSSSGTAPPPGTALPVTLRTLGFGLPGGRKLRAVNLRAHLREKKESKPVRPTRARSSSLCAARREQLGPGHPVGAFRADKASYPCPFSLAGKLQAQPRPRESHDHPWFSN